MPGPDPQGLDIEESEDGVFRQTAEVWRYGNGRARMARMNAVAERIKWDGWLATLTCREARGAG